MASRSLILAALFLCTGCGYKGSPISHEKSDPDRIADLAAEVVEDRIEITFTVPRKTADGRLLSGVDDLVVYRAEPKAGTRFCFECGRMPEQISPERISPPPDQNLKPGDSVLLIDRPPLDRMPTRVVYTVAALNRISGPGKPAEPIYLDVVTSPAPVGALEAKLTGHAAAIAWTPVTTDFNGGALDRPADYRVERKGKTGFVAYVEDPIFVDPTLTFGGPTTYVVRARITVGKTRIVGGTSPPLVINAIDKKAPDPPSRVATYPGAEGVRLRWEDPADPSGIATIEVFRSDKIDGDYQKISEVSGAAMLFLDKSAAPGKIYYYQLRAIDGSPAANRSEPSAPIKTRTISR